MAEEYEMTDDELDQFHSRFVPIALKIIGNLDKAKDKSTEYISRRIVVALSVIAREIEKARREFETSKGITLCSWRPEQSDAFNIVCSAYYARMEGLSDVPHWNTVGGNMLAGFAAGMAAAKMAEAAFAMIDCMDDIEICINGADLLAPKAGDLDARDDRLNAALREMKRK